MIVAQERAQNNSNLNQNYFSGISEIQKCQVLTSRKTMYY